MNFIEYKTSDRELQPCAEAIPSTCDVWDRRSVTEEEFDRRWLGGKARWRDEGTHHRLAAPGSTAIIERKLGDEPCWRVALTDLGALAAFVAKHGEVIITTRGGELALEIYDTYRE